MQDLFVEEEVGIARIRGGMKAEGEISLSTPGVMVDVELPELGSAGYLWSAETEGTRQISSGTREDGVRRPEAQIGSAYLRHFLFEAPDPGTEAIITLTLSRPWEKDEERTVRIRVSGK